MQSKGLTSKTILAAYLFCLASISTRASAADTGVTELLRAGYEVKAAYSTPGEVQTVQVLIVQKGASAYQCTSYSSINGFYQPYSNTYGCSEIQNYIPK